MDNTNLVRILILAIPAVIVLLIAALLRDATLLRILSILLSLILVVLLLLQVRGSNLNVLGDAETSFRARRGLERWLFLATIFVTVDFLLVSILSIAFGI